ncbi:MAG TPA: hypothetical protein DEB39_16075 [Planctomycetaceae bacterium]|nr:hypothetical protein [Planctomycetaceae bacterium]
MKKSLSIGMDVVPLSVMYAVFVYAVLFVAVPLKASNPLGGMVDGIKNLTRRSVEADPKNDYVLDTTNGPWMIHVAIFNGPTAKEDAKTLVLELRNKYAMKAFLFDKTFKHDLKADEAPALGYGAKYQKHGENHEYAVLVGDFQSIDETGFQDTLKQIKAATPECLKPDQGKKGPKTASQKLASSFFLPPNMLGAPLANAFATPNPLLPPGSRCGVVDEFIEKLNSVSEYSLLKNPGRYTVCVATFTGEVHIFKDQAALDKFVDESDRGKANRGKGSELEKAGRAAVILCELLRAKGYEAYEFHDRNSSIVTVGGFDMIGTRSPDGRIRQRPEIVDIMNRFTAQRVNPSQYAGSTNRTIAFEPVKVGGIECDLQPKIIEVPKRPRK